MKIKSLWVVTSAAGALFVGAAVVGASMLWRIHSAKGALEASRMERSRLEERIADVQSIRSFLEHSKGKIASAEKFFVSEDEIVPFIEALEASARESDVQLAVATASLPTSSGANPSFNLKATGEFQDLFRYLLLLENFPHLIAIEKVSFTKTSPWDMQITIRLLAYESRP